MLHELTPDQDFLRETTAKFLTSLVPVGQIRRLRDDPRGFDPDYWRRGAELGWVSLLVGEDQGGGSVSGRGLVDLTVIAHEYGAHAAPGPLVPCNVVAAALAGLNQHGSVVEGLLAGTSTAAWCWVEPSRPLTTGRYGLEITVEGDEVVLNGTKRPVEAAADTGHLLVTGRSGGGRSGEGLSQVLVPTATAGVSVRPLQTVDLTRRFSEIAFGNVRLPATALVGTAGGAADAVEHQLQLGLVIQCAETVGAMDRAFSMTVEWAFDRYSFGRPLASYQELKHRFADMKVWLEAAHAIADAAADAVADRRPTASHLTSVAKAFIGHYGRELMQDCVQMHGGIGVTFEHDLHLFLRRATANSSILGTPADHRQRIAQIAIEDAGIEEAGSER